MTLLLLLLPVTNAAVVKFLWIVNSCYLLFIASMTFPLLELDS